MDTIYSKVIWGELGYSHENFKIHEQDSTVVEELIINWVKEADLERIETVLFEISSIDKVTYETYYDGPFYGISQRKESIRKEMYDKDNKGNFTCDFLFHDTQALATILHMSLKTRISPAEIRFMADVLEAYYRRLSKEKFNDNGAWDHHKKQGTEI